MKPNLAPPVCSGCQHPAVLVPKLTRFRRGDRVLPFDGFIWECSSGCADPVDGSVPYQFSTFDLMEWEEAQTADAWRDRYGEPMPSPLRSRRPEEQRTVRIPLLLTPAEADRLDRLRGDRSRAEFVRKLLIESEKQAG